VTDTIGVDVGGSFIKALRLDLSGTVEDRDTLPVPGSPGEVTTAVEQLVRRLQTVETRAVGVGMAGLVRWPEGEFVWGPHLPWVALAIGETLRLKLGLPVVIDNDANCAAIAELRVGAARGCNDAVLVAIGTGIGGGLIIGGEVYRGTSFAGELGHLNLATDGDACACGRRGCWETLVSMARLQPWLERAGRGEAGALEAIGLVGRWLGRGLALVVTVLDPEVIIVGGGAIEAAGDLLLPQARAELERVIEGSKYRTPTEVRAAATGVWAGALGAGLLASDLASQPLPSA